MKVTAVALVWPSGGGNLDETASGGIQVLV